ncbi:TetR/AcrR family transcriptional regulator [Ectopseudomonas mendocina]|uniref:TetR/AcrR family transcriptional regulator n=1 Tax=Ectopseudomonas mendocina TaxID=300 RepID=A0ABZ2RH74_ECTME
MENLPTRSKLIHAMADALQRKGLHGVGLSEILEISGVPKGSLYHHFPGGKTQLAVAAIDAIGEQSDQHFSHLFSQQPAPLKALKKWLAGALVQLENSRFERGCPLATIALESSPDDVEIRAALQRCFVTIRRGLSDHLHAFGYSREQADKLSALFVSLYEGVLLQARVAGSSEPLLNAIDALFELTEQQHLNGTHP